MPSPDTVNLAQTLYSRCLENDLKPDKLQFTKLLYLIDYCRYSLKGEKVTDIQWIFYHYGPWAYEMPNIMDGVMERYPFGWEDRSEEYGGHMPRFDPAEKLERSIEVLISKVVNAFRLKDTNTIIEWCYKQTEPMRAATRGDVLDFSTIEVTREMPDFFPGPKTWEMPKVPDSIEAKKKEFRERMRKKKAQYQRWKENLSAPEYLEAMQIVAQENKADIPDLSKAKVSLDKDVVDELAKLKDEQ